jgi:hypothetical protein
LYQSYNEISAVSSTNLTLIEIWVLLYRKVGENENCENVGEEEGTKIKGSRQVI